MAMMGDRVFLDTGILLRIAIANFPFHPEARRLIAIEYRRNSQIWISRQVIREFLVQATRPQSFMKPLTIKKAIQLIEGMHGQFTIANETSDVTKKMFDLLKTYPTTGKQVHDANIVATMLVNNVTTLLTHNPEDMRRFASIITVVPLVKKD
jgi:predicted nucleic acid-binding protein